MRRGILRIILGIGIALNGAVLWNGVDVFLTVDALYPPPALPKSYDVRLDEIVEKRCGAPIAKLFERCQSVDRASMETLGLYMAMTRRVAIVQMAISAVNIALLAGLLIAFTRRNETSSA
ncbi:MAG: hypothetical protein E6Q50_15320 [Lysobacter sp.]|nr:MAG: hypothetical protein E6Q50_15320 [Lysobacter sp.]